MITLIVIFRITAAKKKLKAASLLCFWTVDSVGLKQIALTMKKMVATSCMLCRENPERHDSLKGG